MPKPIKTLVYRNGELVAEREDPRSDSQRWSDMLTSGRRSAHRGRTAGEIAEEAERGERRNRQSTDSNN